ncbi:zinc-binding dehydrogenase [Gordonia sp. CPCC 206044]|uniref:zinc-binding dehydrogenase n=1 Tax=Gordonia sp. CPCC 206044 TaxID=3140793 RepID=UPI003AF3D543
MAAVLPDAGLVPYHSISAARELLRPGATAVVIGIGGLGQFAIEILRTLTGVQIITLDVKAAALEAVGDTVDLSLRADSDGAVEAIIDHTGGYGAEFVLDRVGSTATLRMSSAVVARMARFVSPG